MHSGVGDVDPLRQVGEAELVAREQELSEQARLAVRSEDRTILGGCVIPAIAGALGRPIGRSERGAAPQFSYSGGYYPLKR